MTPFFSVIIPTYNVAPYVRTCVESVLAAVDKLHIAEDADMHQLGVEIICVDDGATDESGRILDEIAEDHIRIGDDLCALKVVHQMNKGLGPARNTGLDCATGEYVTFVDSDDAVAPEYFICLSRLIREAKTDQVVFSFAEVKNQTEKHPVGLETFVRLDLSGDEALKLVVGRLGSMFAWRCATSRLAIGKTRFQAIQPGEDVLFASELIQHLTSIAYTEASLYRYLQRQGSTMRSRVSFDFARRAISVTRMCFDVMSQWKNFPLVRDCYLRNLLGYYAGGLTSVIQQVSVLDRTQAKYVFFDCGSYIFKCGCAGFIFKHRLWLLWRVTYRMSWCVKVLLLRLSFVRHLKSVLRNKSGVRK